MNKTVNINLGGMFFHIDEDAYQKLTRYFDAIKRSLSNSSGQDEIIKDIEMRIGELITEKHTSDKQVINIKEVDEIIAVMGQPEDYRIEDDGAAAGPTSYDFVKRNKKLYRDTEKGMLGGVCSGLSHYFGIDTVWLRIALVLLVWAFGTGIVAYIVLWIITPAAVTTAEKLEMTGEPVTISNIEKKVREEFENVSEKFKNANYDKMGNQMKTGVERFAGSIGEVFSTVFKIFAKVLGAIITVFAAVMLVCLFVGMFTLGSTSFVDVPWQNYIDAAVYTNIPLWVIGLLTFLAIGIPFFFLFILGLKLLVNNLKSIGNIAKYTLLALWLIAVACLITFGIKQATEVAFDGKSVQKENIILQPADTLKVKFRFNDYYAKNVDNRNDYIFTQDEKNVEQIYSNEVRIHIQKTDEKVAYIQIEKKAQGKSLIEAKKRAEAIKYAYKIEGSTLILDNYLLTETTNKFRGQEVEIFLYLPEGTLLKPDNSIENYDRSDDDFFNLHYSGSYLYKVDKNQVKCLDCPANENEYGDVINGETVSDSTSGTTVTIDSDHIKIEKDGKEQMNGKVGTLDINKDGIIVKTK
ncbi:MAG TPA: PspC domain-containing protein [Flavobacterium sp.]|nr:PspC domain-containing protein [Flavobacterium sp.]